jgi:hypothetical protein
MQVNEVCHAAGIRHILYVRHFYNIHEYFFLISAYGIELVFVLKHNNMEARITSFYILYHM